MYFSFSDFLTLLWHYYYNSDLFVKYVKVQLRRCEQIIVLSITQCRTVKKRFWVCSFFLLLEIPYIEYLIWSHLYISKVSNWKSSNKKVSCIKKKIRIAIRSKRDPDVPDDPYQTYLFQVVPVVVWHSYWDAIPGDFHPIIHVAICRSENAYDGFGWNMMKIDYFISD